MFESQLSEAAKQELTHEQVSCSEPLSLAQLVAYITSARVIDYTSMSDFFLTFRLYATAQEVLELLLARLNQSMAFAHADPSSEQGRDAAVRTFVVVRHWVDNFFADDFLPNFDLRQQFSYAMSQLESSPLNVFPQIFQQIAKVWNRRLRTYWDVAQLDVWPLCPGGEFGAEDFDIAGRRRTLLSFYSGPIDPMQIPEEAESRQLGSIIRGGILVNTNPQVACIRTTPKKHKPKSRFFRRSRPTEPSEVPLEGKVDLLALQVLTDLKNIIKVRQQLGDLTGDVEDDDTPRLPTSESQKTLKAAHETMDTLDIAQVLDDSASLSGSLGSTSDSFIDLRRSTIATNLLGNIPYDTASNASFSSLSTLSYTMSTRDSASFRSENYDAASSSNISLLSELTSGYEMAPCAGFNKHVAAELAAIPDDSMQEDAILVAIQKLEGTWHQDLPYRQQYQTSSPRGDSGRYLCNVIRSVPSFVSADTKLYSQAFSSATHLPGRGVSVLAIPQYYDNPVTGSPGYFVGDGVQRFSSSTMQTVIHSPNISLNHVPFILSLSAETLAEQMTLLEKDALEQVDWKELVEIQWTQSASEIYSWLGFLATHNIRGVDVVTARFNLVLNWVRSEVLLCCQASLQARTLERFIHVASECEKLQNYTTLIQLVLALSGELLRSRTTAWSLVDKQSMATLHRLENLVSPLRNFRNLRAAHKKIDFQKGCIPFAGLYLADLLHNDQKPSWIEGKINFPKFKSGSTLARSLIQCIEWSKNYRIMPKPDVLSKCLYLQSLTTEEMDLAAK